MRLRVKPARTEANLQGFPPCHAGLDPVAHPKLLSDQFLNYGSQAINTCFLLKISSMILGAWSLEFSINQTCVSIPPQITPAK